jgi:hypothetical protein
VLALANERLARDAALMVDQSRPLAFTCVLHGLAAGDARFTSTPTVHFAQTAVIRGHAWRTQQIDPFGKIAIRSVMTRTALDPKRKFRAATTIERAVDARYCSIEWRST